MVKTSVKNRENYQQNRIFHRVGIDTASTPESGMILVF